MKVGDRVKVCTCLLKDTQPHLVATKNDGACMYCGYQAIDLILDESSLRKINRREEQLRDIKWQRLELMVKEARHGDKIN